MYEYPTHIGHKTTWNFVLWGEHEEPLNVWKGVQKGARKKRRPMMGSVSGFDSSSVNILHSASLSPSLTRLASEEETRAKSFRIRR